MWIPDDFTSLWQRGSFVEAVPIPSSQPGDQPLVCIEVNPEWIPYICGALMQLMQPSTWIAASPSALAAVLGAVTDLIAIVGTAVQCMQAGTQSVTITAGNAVGTQAVTFPVAFSSTPVVVVSEDSGDYIASATSVTDTGFTASLTANVNQPANVSATVSWMARIP